MFLAEVGKKDGPMWIRFSGRMKGIGETRRRWNFAGKINESEKKKERKKERKKEKTIMEKDKGVDGIN